jgi:hypothetical protein
MKLFLIGALLPATACSTAPPEGSLAKLKYDQRKVLMTGCMKLPEQFGFPNTRAQNADLLGLMPGFAPNVYTHCRRVAHLIVR